MGKIREYRKADESYKTEETVKQFLRRLKSGAVRGRFTHHYILQHAFSRAGFVVKTVIRRSDGPVWSLSLRPGTVTDGKNPKVIQQVTSRILRRLRNKTQAKEVGVFVSGQYVNVSFSWPKGNPGTKTFWKLSPRKEVSAPS